MELAWYNGSIDQEVMVLRDECYAACFGGGIGPAFMDMLSVEDMSPEELLRAARLWGIDVDRFTI